MRDPKTPHTPAFDVVGLLLKQRGPCPACKGEEGKASSPAVTDAYRDGWDSIFGKRPRGAGMSNKNTEPELFDEELAYDEQIFPLMGQIIAICKERRIAMAATFQYCNCEDTGAGYVTTTIPVDGRTDERMQRVIATMQPERSIAFAETRTTDPATGKTTISIRRIT